MANDNWGDTARFGIFVVGSEVVPEAEWWAMTPRGVSVHAARVTAPAPWAGWQADGKSVALAPDLERGAAQFAGMRLAVVVLAHTSSSLVGGPGWDAAVTAALKARVGESTQVTTNGADCLAALRACGVHRPFLVAPPWFRDDAMAAGVTYVERHGFTVAKAFRHVPDPRWANERPEDLYKKFMHIEQNVELLGQQIVDACPPSADGVMIAGTGFRCVGIIDALEAALGRPVVTANQASLWRCLTLAGVRDRVPGYGRLLGGDRG
jgi:maleate isomerase